MKKLLCLLVCLMVSLTVHASAENSNETKALPRGKSLGITKTEWINRYNAIPTKIVGQKTDVYLMLLVEEDYRKQYLANPLENVDFIVMCEDNTDEVVAVLLQIHLNELRDSYDLGNSIGQFITESIYRMALATDQTITVQTITDTIFPALDVQALKANQDFSNSVNSNGYIYVFQLENGVLSYGIKNSIVYENEEAFLKNRSAK